MSFEDFYHNRTTDEVYSSADSFAGQKVIDFHPKEKLSSGVCYRLRSDWDGNPMAPLLKSFLDSPAAPEATALVIGYWAGDDVSLSSASVIEPMVASRHRLANLKALYLGDITSEESEMSWIEQSDVAPLLQAFPQLELLRIRGGNSLAISRPIHHNLRALAIETGGLDKSVVRSLGQAEFPNLEYLELWLGAQEYGGNVTAQELAPILSGELFPNLRYLGLRNSQIIDQLTPAIVSSPLVGRIEELDLSLGLLSNLGALELAKLQTPSLKRLNLHYNYISPEFTKALKESTFEVDLSNPKHMYTDPEDRFIVVGE